ncbi:MAG TPA: diguanylate cyclase, partial [Pyrinomonadaceae bacterium]|nr:diguanylate cyclase [Pyrinomonadaceae bacterium]
KVIGAQLRDYDFLARYGGDEFVAIVPETKAEDISDLCLRIESAVAAFELPFADGQSARVGVSPGSATYQRGLSFDEMVIAADKAMYLRKTVRKRIAAIDTANTLDTAAPGGSFILELDESHVVSAAVN